MASLAQKQNLSPQQLSLLESEIKKHEKNMVVAYLLCIFLGGLGLHKFYLGNKKSGIIYLVLTIIGGILSIVGVGLVLLAIVGILCIIDLFTIPGQIKKSYEELEDRIIGEILANSNIANASNQ